MDCPKCHGKMEEVVFGEVAVDRCLTCSGLWFDLLEKEDLMQMEGSEIIDIGSGQVGKRYSDMRDIDCPHCEQPMIPMVDKDQFHIKYESCPSCFGAFFDAGEFRDLKEHTVIERFLQMIKTVRTNL